MELKRNVLVIDDNADLRDSLKQLLEKLGCEVATAATAEAGRERIRQSRYDAVFASLCMERLGDTHMAKWTQENAAGRTKFFVTTGWQGDLEPDLLRCNGINDVIRRPFNLNELREKVRAHLGQGE
jgi:DNA-binding response OmpR family regulator